MLKLGISGQALGDVMPFSDIVRMGKKYGVYDYEVWPCNVAGSGNYTGAGLEELKKVVREEGVRICCVTQGAGFSPEIMEDPAGYAEILSRTVEAAAALGAPVVNHYCVHISPGEVPDFGRMEKYWAAPLKRAEEMGITLVLENEAHDSTSTPRKMLSIMEHFHNPFFKTNLDVVNYFHASCEGFPGAYEILKPYVGYVHLKNACLFDPDRKQPEYNRGAPMSGAYGPAPIQYAPIPEGAVNIAGLVERLERDGEYQGVCTLEPHTTPEHVEEFYAAESAWLRKLGFFL